MRRNLLAACTLLLPLLGFEAPATAGVTSIDGTWSSLDASVQAPDGRREYAAVYDRVHRRYILFSGFTNEQGQGYWLFNEVWTMTLGDTPTWTQLTIPGTVPGERHSPQWGYDPTRNRLLVFGGYGRHYPGYPYAYLNDVWELKLNGSPSWNELTPSGTPPAGRLAGVAAYDVLNQRFVGFGGTAGLPIDTWQLDLRGQPTWATVPTNGTRPMGSYGMTAIFDTVRNRMVIFGGSYNAGYFGTRNDTWELDLQQSTPTWRQLNPAGTLPAARRSLTSIFDARRDRMVIFGGWDGTDNANAFLGDTWALSLSDGDGTWTQLSPGGVLPSVRNAMAAAYDPRGDRMVVFGGWSGHVMLGDTQFLTWDDEGQAPAASPGGVEIAGVAHLEWNTDHTMGPIGAVYRRQIGTEWTSLGTVEADAQGTITFEDSTINPEEDYGYKLVVSSEIGDEFVGEVWLSEVSGVGPGSSPAPFALRVAPNPAQGPIAISFQLASDKPARFEMFDVLGQRLVARDIEASEIAGGSLVQDTRGYPSGTYFVRLTQEESSATTRLVVR